MADIILRDENLRVFLDPLGVKVETLLMAGTEEGVTTQILTLTWTEFDILKNLPWCALEGVVRPARHSFAANRMANLASAMEAQWAPLAGVGIPTSGGFQPKRPRYGEDVSAEAENEPENV